MTTFMDTVSPTVNSVNTYECKKSGKHVASWDVCCDRGGVGVGVGAGG